MWGGGGRIQYMKWYLTANWRCVARWVTVFLQFAELIVFHRTSWYMPLTRNMSEEAVAPVERSSEFTASPPAPSEDAALPEGLLAR